MVGLGMTDDHHARWRAFRDNVAKLPQPEHVPSRAAFDAELVARLAISSECRANWDRYQASTRRQARPDYLPVRMDVENVSRCVFACAMCQVSAWPKLKRAKDMSVDAFTRLLDEQMGLVEVKLHGMGEPLLGGEDFFQMVRIARERRIWVRTVTNAYTLHQKNAHRALIETGINEVQISVHGADRDSVKAITGRDSFERVTENCRLINRTCEEMGVLRTKMWTVVQKDNAGQLPAMVELAARTGFKTMVFSLDLNDWGQTLWGERNAAIRIGPEFDIEQAWRMVERGRELGVRVAFWQVQTVHDADHLCPWPFERAFIASDMRIVPCCMLGNPDYCEIGQGAFTSFSERWQGDEYAAFRQAHIDGDPPEVCRGCYRKKEGM